MIPLFDYRPIRQLTLGCTLSLLFLTLLPLSSVNSQTLLSENANNSKIGRHFALNGGDSCVDFGEVSFKTEFTFSLWVKPETVHEYNTTIFSLGDRFLFNIDRFNRQLYAVKVNHMERRFPNSFIKERNWQHLTFRYKNEVIDLYQNGKKKGRIHFKFPNRKSYRMIIGGGPWRGHLKGKVAHPLFFSYALKSEKINKLHNDTKPKIDLKDNLSLFTGHDPESWKRSSDWKNLEHLLKENENAKTHLVFNNKETRSPQSGPVNSGNTGTISLWVLPKKDIGKMAMVNIGNSLVARLEYGQDITLIAHHKREHYLRGIKLSHRMPSHLVITFSEGDEVKFYLNGQLIEKQKMGPIWRTPISRIDLGTSYWGQSQNFVGSMYDVGIWTRELTEEEIRFLFSNSEKASLMLSPPKTKNVLTNKVWPLAVLVLASTGIPFFFIRKRRKASLSSAILENYKAPTIRLFGELEILNKKNFNVGQAMSPKIKEILIFILLRTLQNSSVKTAELNEIFWPGQNKEKTKNNRGVSIKRIRDVLKDCENIELVYERNGSWKVKLGDSTLCDYSVLKSLVSKTDNISIKQGMDILKKGAFIPYEKYDSLNEFRTEFLFLLTKAKESWIIKSDKITDLEKEEIKKILLTHQTSAKTSIA
ncbi:hypothetical protein FUAX_23990 [Fulvitalea axinellae]|uniref:LamG-like jellyroll fold domain-containing protein n=1 Tax=Fulvitalea axinellae TaxID=1182444 RepID=A0AAU9CX29_9BACT|nr:hypothetical protein FUAX_23990 [Fulvitalea axinellae]